MRDEGKPLTIHGDGCQTRDYVHIDDVVRANLNAAQLGAADGKRAVALNVGSGVETSVNEIAELVGGEVEHIYPNPRGAFEELRKCSDNSRAKSVISWEPRIASGGGDPAAAVGAGG